MRYFPEKLIEGIEKKFPFLQRKRTPKTAEQRKEQDKEYHRQKRGAESKIEKEMRQEQDKEFHRQKRAAESKIEQEMRLNKQKEFELERYTQSPQVRAKKIRYEHDKRLAETEK